MPAFRTSGSTGQAPNTIWFGAIVDRLNMLCPSQFPTSPYNTSIAPAHYGNLWFPFNSSFGSFTTAPDGTTNTAQLLVEDSSNNKHFIQAGGLPGGGGTGAISSGYGLGRIRLAGYFKNAGRRLGYTVAASSGGIALTVVFDLAGGQVGVAASVSGTSNPGIMKAAGTQIIPAADGFYLCIQDLYFKDNGTNILATCFLDSGTGTGALSNSYTGDGVSGVVCWRTNMMPVAAWSINNTIFFDDFISLSTIDLNNTKAPGFNWYPSAGTWTNYIADTGAPYPSSQFSVADSVLTIAPDLVHANGQTMLGSAAQISDVGGTYVGQGFGGGKPTLIEARMNFNYAIQDSATGTWWASSLEWIVAQGLGLAGALASQPKFPYAEFDLVEASGLLGTSNTPDTDALFGVGIAVDIDPLSFIASLSETVGAQAGMSPWNATYDYGSAVSSDATIVIQDGVLYQPLGVHNINHIPPNASFWNVLTSNTLQVPTDPSQMQVYSHLIIPYWGQAGVSGSMAQQATMITGADPGSSGEILGTVPDPSVGVKMSFWNGLWCNTAGFWGPNISFIFPSNDPGSYLWLADAGHIALWLSAGKKQSLNVDYIKVMQ